MRNLLKKVIFLASAFLFAAGGPMWATPTVTQINATSSSFDALVTGNAVLIHVGGSHAGFVYEDPNTHFLCVNTSITQADAASQNAFLFMVTRTNDAFSFRNKASNLYMPAVDSPHLEQLVDTTTAGSFTVASYVTNGSDFYIMNTTVASGKYWFLSAYQGTYLEAFDKSTTIPPTTAKDPSLVFQLYKVTGIGSETAHTLTLTVGETSISTTLFEGESYTIPTYYNGYKITGGTYNGSSVTPGTTSITMSTSDLSGSLTATNMFTTAGLTDGGYYQIDLPKRTKSSYVKANGDYMYSTTETTNPHHYAASEAWLFKKKGASLVISKPSATETSTTGYSYITEYPATTTKAGVVKTTGGHSGCLTNPATLWSIEAIPSTTYYALFSTNYAGTNYYLNNGNVNVNLGLTTYTPSSAPTGDTYSFTSLPIVINFTFKDEAGNTLSDIGIAANGGTEYGSALYMPTNHNVTSLVLENTVTSSSVPTVEKYTIGSTDYTDASSFIAALNALTATGTTNVTVTVSNRYTVTIRCLDKAGYTLQSSTVNVASYTGSAPAIDGYTLNGTSFQDANGNTINTLPSPLTGNVTVIYTYGLTNLPFIATVFKDKDGSDVTPSSTTTWDETSGQISARYTRWYTMAVNRYVASNTGYCYALGATVDGTTKYSISSTTAQQYNDAYMFCFVGDEASGYRMYNKAVGPYYPLDMGTNTTANSTSVTAYFASEATSPLLHVTYYGGSYFFDAYNAGMTYNNYLNRYDNELINLYKQGTAPSGLDAIDLAGSQFAFSPLDNWEAGYFRLMNAQTETYVAENYSVTDDDITYSGWKMSSLDMSSPSQIWYIEPTETSSGSGTYYFTFYCNGHYLGPITAQNQTDAIAMVDSKEAAGKYTLTAYLYGLVATKYDGTNTYSINNGWDLYWNGTSLVAGSVGYTSATATADADGDTNHKFGLWVADKATYLEYTTNSTCYSTACYPFSVTLPEGMKAYYVSAAGNGTATLASYSSSVRANVPMMLHGESSGTKYNISINTTATTGDAVQTDNMLEGNVLAKTVESTKTAYVLSKKNDDESTAIFYLLQSGTGRNFYPNRSYLVTATNQSQQVKEYSINFGDDNSATDIQTPQTVGNTMKGINIYYDLAGRRIAKPTAPGIYITNGRKFLVR